MNDTLQRPAHPTFSEAFWYWLRLGFLSFGGPAGQISMMHQELVEKRRWIGERRFLHALNYCMVLPGPEAQQLAIYIGWMLHRTRGGIVAGTLFVLPSLFILAGLTYVYLAFGEVTIVKGLFNGIKPAVVAIVVFAAWRIGTRALKNRLLWAIAAASFIAIFALKIPFPYIVLGAGILGFIGGKVWPEKFKVGGGHGASNKTYGPALIDDDTPSPEHTRFKPMYLALLLLAGLALWGAAMLTLSNPVLKDMGAFFTKAAYSAQPGHPFQAKLDTDSRASWTVIPREAGQLEHSDAGFLFFTLKGGAGSTFLGFLTRMGWRFCYCVTPGAGSIHPTLQCPIRA